MIIIILQTCKLYNNQFGSMSVQCFTGDIPTPCGSTFPGNHALFKEA